MPDDNKRNFLARCLVATVVVATTTIAVPGVANAAPSCDGKRSTSKTIAKDYPVLEPRETHVPAGPRIVLRHSPDTGCVWGLMTDVAPAVTGVIWLETSDDGGQTWHGELGKRSEIGIRHSIFHTGAFTAVPGGIRACGYALLNTQIIPEPGNRKERLPHVLESACTSPL